MKSILRKQKKTTPNPVHIRTTSLTLFPYKSKQLLHKVEKKKPLVHLLSRHDPFELELPSSETC